MQVEQVVSLCHATEYPLVPGQPRESLLRTHEVHMRMYFSDHLGVVRFPALLIHMVAEMQVINYLHVMCLNLYIYYN